MPPRVATRTARAEPPAASTRTTRSTRTTTRTKQTELAADHGIDEVTSQMKRVLKVSDPEPQATSTASRSKTTSKVNGSSGVSKPDIVEVKPARASTTKSTTTAGRVASRAKISAESTASTAGSSQSVLARRAAVAPSKTASQSKATTAVSKPPAAKIVPTASASSGSRPHTSINPAASSRSITLSSQSGPVTSKPNAEASTSTLKRVAPPATSVSMTGKRVATRPQVSLKGKEKEQVQSDLSPTDYPWSDLASSMAANDRAQKAMTAIKTSLANLSTAVKIGFTYGTDKDDWTSDRAGMEITVCDTALRILRHLDEDGQLGNKGIEVEKAGQAVIARTMSLGMHRRALDQLVAARIGVMRQYTVAATALPRTPDPERTPDTQRLPSEWITACWLPSPEGDDPSAIVSTLCFQQLIAAWSCMISLEGYGFDLPPFAELLPGVDSTPTGWRNPLRLALQSSLSSTFSALSYFTRRVSHIPLTAPHWPHVFTIIAQALILTASASTIPVQPPAPTPRTPASIWDTVAKWIKAFVDRGDAATDRPEVASCVIGRLTSWADEVIAVREEERRLWYQGEAWTALLNIWIDLARKSRDTKALDQALSLSTASLELGLTRTASEATQNDQRSDDTASAKFDSSEQALLRSTAIFAQLGTVESVADATSKAEASAIVTALRQTDWTAYGSCVAGLPNDKAGQEAFARSYRTTERARRPVAEILRKGRAADPELFDTACRWMLGAANAIGYAVTHSPLVENANYDSLVSCCINAVTYPLYYRSNAEEASDLLEPLQIGRRIASLGRTPTTRAECLKGLADGAYNVAHGLHGHQRYELAADIAQMCIEVAQLAIAEFRNIKQKETPQVWTDFIAKYPVKYEILASCLFSSERKEDAIRIVSVSLAAHDAQTYVDLASSSGGAKLDTIFEKRPRLDGAISRLATYLANDLEPLAGGVIQSRIDTLFRSLEDQSKIPVKATGLIVERLLQAVIHRSCKRDGLQTSHTLGTRLLGLLQDHSLALRRLRVIASLMLLTSSHGLRSDDFETLVEQADASLDILRSDGKSDENLIAEYRAVILVIRALNAYQVSHQPAQVVLDLSTLATNELRQLLVPPIRSKDHDSDAKVAGKQALARVSDQKPSGSTAVKKSVRSASENIRATKSSVTLSSDTLKKRRSSIMPVTDFDDVSQLASLLTSLVSLLGLLGHTLAKVNVLKVLRALLRHRPDFVDAYVSRSGELATLYSKLGKYSRSSVVFAQAIRTAKDSPKPISPAVQVELHLRHSNHFASLGEVEAARAAYHEAERHHDLIDTSTAPLYRQRVMQKTASIARMALAYRAQASICLARDDAAGAIRHLKLVMGLRSRAVNNMALLAIDRAPTSESPDTSDDKPKGSDGNPFVVPDLKPDQTGANEPSREEVIAKQKAIHPFKDKTLHGVQWASAEHVVEAYIDLANAYARRGSPADARYYLNHAEHTAKTVRSSAMEARTATRYAVLENRLKQLEKAETKIGEATTSLGALDGPDAFDLGSAKGQLLARQELADQASEILLAANNGIHDLDTVFVTADALLPSPRKDAAKRPSLATSSRQSSKEPLLPSTLSQVLRQQAWLYREAGQLKESDDLYRQVRALQSSSDMKAEELYANGRIALEDAFSHFKTDLFMSSLTESTIAMPMGTPGGMFDHRQSARHRIQIMLDQANEAYRSALSLVAGSGRVEDVRQACLSLALLRAFQTSLGQGDTQVTSFAADLLVSSTSVTLHRELLEAAENKFYDFKIDDAAWPKLDDGASMPGTAGKVSDREDEPTDDRDLQRYWADVRARYLSNAHLSPDKLAYDLSVLPRSWAVLSISVTEDRNTMFISRHQNGHDPLVFCLPLDRQGKREGEDDPFTFEMGSAQLREIITENDACSKSAKTLTTDEQKLQWWATKRALDKRMEDLIENVEYCWLGAFKTIFNPRLALTSERLGLFRTRIERVFNLALFGSAHETKKTGKVHLDDSLLECFATLSSSSREEEIEDFVYFILDIYQFHGVPVAIAELDLDQIGVDVVTVLTEMEASLKSSAPPAEGPEHILLALDKNAQAFPWESIPCLRGRPVSRIPSLPVLLDQVALGKVLQPGETRRIVNSKKTYFILNPSGDLKNTQATFEPMLKEMQDHSGWMGVIGEKPSELEMTRILRDYDLVLYFGHGGGEQYIRGSKVRVLPKCATTFLWGCSSGKLVDQGDLDAAGTAWNYMMAGCPALTATLWDVTDRDIDRLTTAVYNKLGLSPSQIMEQGKPRAEHSAPGLLAPSGQGMGISTVEAVNQSRNDCKMTYLTGAAVVHYGIPVYIY